MVINPDNLQLTQNRDWVDYLNLVFQSFIAVGIIRWLVSLKKKKEVVEGEFTFETKEKTYRVILGLRNRGENRIDFDPKQGVYVLWGIDRYHKINLIEDEKNSSIQPQQGSVQLRYLIELDTFEKPIIDSGKIKVFIYTNRNNRFQLNPAPMQLNKWGITIEQYEELVKDL